MKLATERDGSRDGKLLVVSRDLKRAAPATGIAATMQEALENWVGIEPALRDLSAKVETGDAPGLRDFDAAAAMAPLPRAWQWLDGSTYESHDHLLTKAFGLEPTVRERPLMYQGLSNHFYGPTDDIPLPSEDDGIDFEGEFGVIVDDVPVGTDAAAAARHVRLIVLINDWSLRHFSPIEMRTGFGWINAKPPCSVAPVAVTPDELGGAWHDGQVGLRLNVWWNAEPFGHPMGDAMAFSFLDLIAHAARTRSLCAGTIVGSGTVSNHEYREVGSACIAERRGIEMIDHGTAQTAFMRFGDEVRMEANLPGDDAPVFGTIHQRVVRA
jgi:fumarylacetoacetate (FAA) hydrolase